MRDRTAAPPRTGKHRPSAVGKIAERTDAALVAGSVDDSTV